MSDETVEDGPSFPNAIIVPLSLSILAFASGASTSSRLSSLQFLAENAHRKPTTLQGWYHYRKKKNYRVIWGGIRGGLRMAARVGGWSGAMYAGIEGGRWGIENAKKRMGKEEEWTPSRAMSGSIVGIGLAELASRTYQFPSRSPGTRLLWGMLAGVALGGMEDAREWVHRRRRHNEG